MSVEFLIEKIASIDSDVKNQEEQLGVKRIQNINNKRKEQENSHCQERVKVTKPEDRAQVDEYKSIKDDTNKFLNQTELITEENKMEWMELMQRSQDNNNCMGKSQRQKMYSLWNVFKSPSII